MLQITVKKNVLILSAVMFLFSSSIFSLEIQKNTEKNLIQVIEQEPNEPIIGVGNIETTNLMIQVIDQESNEPMIDVDLFIVSGEVFEVTKKTNRQGAVKVQNVPSGIEVLIQATRSGWITFGDHYDIKQNMSTIVIELKKTLK